MIVDFESGGYSKAALARRYGVSRKAVYKWIERYEQESFAGLRERSRAPLHQVNAVEEAIEQELLRMKTRWPLWGAPKLHFKLKEALGASRCPSESTVSNILRRHGLTKPMKRRRVVHQAPARPYGQQPNDVWCADFKGWFKLGNGERCDPLTITDAASRYLIRCQGLCGKTSTEMVMPIFTAAFREHGLPGALRTDNGSPFASSGLAGLSRLSVWWLKHGIELERIEPGHPEQNGRHERMHRTLKEAIRPPAHSLRAQQEAFGKFREHYNHERPHEALCFAVPAACYQPSARTWSEKLPAAPEYPEEWPTRAVRGCGQMTWDGKDVRITAALVGERIGFKAVEDGVWDLYFGNYLLGRFDERKSQVQPPRRSTQRGAWPDVVGELDSSTPLRSAEKSNSPTTHHFEALHPQ
jgi:putative transposase